MAIRSTDEEVMVQNNSSSISKAIIIGAVIIAASNLVGSGIIKPKTGTTALAPQASTAPAVAGAQAPNQAPPQPTTATASLGHFPTRGNKDAQVAIIEFADFRCPFCEQYFTQTEPQVTKDYIDTGKVKIAFRHYEFLGPASITAGNAAECANEQGKFWDYHDYLYKNQPPETDTSMYTTDKLSAAAGTLGMNTTQFKSCLDGTKYSKNLSDDMSDGQNAGVTGTPSFVIGKVDSSGKITDGKLLVGAQPYATFKSTIDSLLQ
jgi:protein-disulfide isomerase